MIKPSFVALSLAIFISTITFAQPASAPASKPTSAPTTAPAPHRLTMPPGFIKVSASERTCLCEPPDKEWVTKALNDLQPTSRPTTMPSDLYDSLVSKKDDLLKQMTQNLGLTDTSVAQKMINDNLIPDMQRMADIRPPMFYMVCTKARLLELIKGGWSDPRFYYNRVAEDVAIYDRVDLSIQHAMDDLLIPALYDPAKPVNERIDFLQKQIDKNEANIAANLSIQAQIMVQSGLVNAVEEAAIKPLALKPGQEWFGIGVEGMLSTRYMAQVNGMRNEDLLKILTIDDRRNPIRASTIDLLHPTEPSQLRNQYKLAYVDALRRRSVIVVNNLIQRAGDDALPKILNAIKQSPPKDGQGLVDLIKQTSGVDIGMEVVPQK
jgi:hypothetical protein